MTLQGTMERPAYRLYRWAWAGLDWLYPPLCGGCERPGVRWCQACQNQTKPIPDHICRHCGQILPVAGVCADCRSSPPQYVALRSWAGYSGPLRNAVHRLKYKGDLALAEILARPLIHLLGDFNWEIDLVTAVPLGVVRQRQRGYNQASLIAFPLALGIGKPFNPGALTRVRETRSQVGLSAVERWVNVAGAFAANSHQVSARRVLVVDDVTTTGSTMAACAAALLEAGALEVYGITLARPLLPEGD